MDYSSSLNHIPKMENQFDQLDWSSYIEDQNQGLWDIPPIDDYSINLFNSTDINSWVSNQNPNTFNFQEFGGNGDDLALWDYSLPQPFLEDIKPVNPIMDMVLGHDLSIAEVKNTQDYKDFPRKVLEKGVMVKRENTNGRSNKKSSVLELEDIRKYFDTPITKAAKELKVGLTVLKKRCRELKIMRWPHRKLKSLKSLIRNVKEMGLTGEVARLEEQRRLLEKIPQWELTDETKKLRQACFKANYQKRRSLAAISEY